MEKNVTNLSSKIHVNICIILSPLKCSFIDWKEFDDLSLDMNSWKTWAILIGSGDAEK